MNSGPPAPQRYHPSLYFGATGQNKWGGGGLEPVRTAPGSPPGGLQTGIKNIGKTGVAALPPGGWGGGKGALGGCGTLGVGLEPLGTSPGSPPRTVQTGIKNIGKTKVAALPRGVWCVCVCVFGGVGYLCA